MKRTKQILSFAIVLVMCLAFAPKPAFAADRTGDLFTTIEALVQLHNPVDGNDAGLSAYGAGVCAFLLTVPSTDTIYLDEIMAWLQATLGGDEAMGWTGAAFDSWSNGNISALEAHASGYGEGVALGVEPVDYYAEPATEPAYYAEPATESASAYGQIPAHLLQRIEELGLSVPENATQEEIERMIAEASAASAAPAVAAAEQPAAEQPSTVPYEPASSSGGWNGVWTRGVDTLAIIGNGARMYHVNGEGMGLSISTMAEEVTDSAIHSNVVVPDFNYYAEYHLTLSGDTLEFMHIYYVDGTNAVIVTDSGTYTRTGEDANAGYERLRNRPETATEPVVTEPVITEPVITEPVITEPIITEPQSTVVPTPSKVFVNGTEMSFEAYNIEGSNYFKLRDIAYVLNGTNKQFEVGYDDATKAVTMTSYTPYTVTGGEMVPGDGQPKPAAPTDSMIFLDGTQLNFTVYNIAGSNFFKLVDLMSALDVSVTYNEATKDIGIDTSASHTGVISGSPAPDTLIAEGTTAAGTVYSMVSTSDNHSLAVASDGSLWGWGTDFAMIQSNTPVWLMDGAAYVSVGRGFSMVIKTDGSLWAWGENSDGQLGDGTTEKRTAPVKIMDGVTKVSAGERHTLAITTDGSLWAWGSNEYGKLGDGTEENRNAPVKIMDGAADAVASYNHSAAVKTDGSLWGWGSNEQWQLSEGLSLYGGGGFNYNTPQQIDIAGVVSVSSSSDYTLVLKADGTLWAFGLVPAEFDVMTPSQTDIGPIFKAPQQIAEGVVFASAGGYVTMAIKTDGSLWSIGSNYRGALGIGNEGLAESRSLVKIVDGISFASTDGAYVLAIKQDGGIYAWGENNYGQLGDGTNEDRYAPVSINQ